MAGLELVLPAEAQWEYACRAGTTEATYAGDLPDLEAGAARVLDGIAWFAGNSDRPQPVARKTPNAWGLYDMLGNVWEWCADHWHVTYHGAPDDGSAWIDEGARTADRVFRGGSWFGEARYCRAAYRVGFGPDTGTSSSASALPEVRGELRRAERGRRRGRRGAAEPRPAGRAAAGRRGLAMAGRLRQDRRRRPEAWSARR